MSKLPLVIEDMLQLNHPEKTLAIFPGMNEQCAADIYGLTLKKYKKIVNCFKDNAKKAAECLLEDKQLLAQIQKLPFKSGQTIIGLGDSITDDYQSWFEILTNIVHMAISDDIRFINAGISGDTTSQMITRFIGVVNNKPDWILCMAGTNDAREHGLFPNKLNVSIPETEANCKMLLHFAKTQTSAKWIWLTPSRVIDKVQENHPYMKIVQFIIRSKNLYPIVKFIRKQKEPFVEIWNAFGENIDPKLLLEDGLHPSLEGHKLIVTKVIDRLSKLDQQADR
jgi:acyl-CoA thioesterase I